MKYLLIHSHLIIDGNREYLDGGLLIEDERIIEVYPQSNKINNPEDCKIIDLNGKLVMPGFFDTHTHGITMMSFDDASEDDLDKMSYEYAKDGTTSFLSSLSYHYDEQIERQLETYERCEGAYSRFQGIHLEGPFLSDKYPGIGNPKLFLNPDVDRVRNYLDKTSKLKQMTIAYELDGAKEVGKLLKDNNVRVMCGHSDALYEDLDDNVDGFTHLFNAMRGLHHRDMTLVNCAFMNRWNVEVIADGNHVHENVLKLVINNIDRDRIMLITDSSIAKNLEDGEYDFMGRHCIKNGTTFKSIDGHLAGSVVSINDEMKVLYRLGAKYTDLLLYSGYNAYRFYNLDKQFGTLEKGKYSDIVIMDDELNISNVMVRGKFIYD